jgi:hypothetical protein
MDFFAENGRASLITIAGPHRERRVAMQLRDEFVALPPGGYVGIAIDLQGMSRFRRLVTLLGLRLRLARVERAIARCGAQLTGRFAMSPDLRSPAVAYPMSGPAAAYAEQNLLPRSTNLMRGIVSFIAGCEASIGAVLVIGRKP